MPPTTYPHPIGPLTLAPRLDPKPWGGRRLSDLGFQLPDREQIGEAVLTDAGNQVRSGSAGGSSLGELIATDPPRYLGRRGLKLTGDLPIFPLLIKFIDAAAPLSIQVHPDDARAPGGSRGKTEAWFILDADPGAVLYVGLNDSAEFDVMAAESRAGTSVGPRMRAIPAIPGQFVFIPAGTIHAIGEGVVLYEIQQPSAVTYRFDDWGRVDEHGNPRELHVEDALAVADPLSRPDLQQPIRRRPGDAVQPCVSCPQFSFEVIEIRPDESMPLDPDVDATALTCIRGSAALEHNGSLTALHAGETVVMLADTGKVDIRGTGDTPCELIRGWVPSA